MRRNLQLQLLAFFIVAILSNKLFSQIDTLCQGSATVMGGEYNVMNNVWGSDTGVGDQCIAVDRNSSYFKVTLSTHNSPSVASYPSIFKGCHWGWCTTSNNQIPIKVQNIQSAPSTWSVNTTNSSGTWNTAYDIWFDNASSFSNDYDAELMIWIDYNGGAGPAGSLQGTVEIGGLSWDVYFVAWTSWNYIAYKITNPVDSVSIDLRDFINDAASRGYIYTPWYLHAIEAGFEIWSDGQNLTANSFSADVIETSTPVNFAPIPFVLQFPSNGVTMNSSNISFRWQNTTDPDLDNFEFILRLSGPHGDTAIAAIDTNRYAFDGSLYFLPNTTYTWYVEATDGIDTTRTTQRTFKTSSTVDIDQSIQMPDEFFLNQNFPNPFNPLTRISYSLKSNSKVYLSIWNLLGMKVKGLIDEVQSAGIHEIDFSGADLPSGTYFYRLQSADGIIIKKMTLLK